MSSRKGRRRDDHPDHPDHLDIVVAIAVDPGNPTGVSVATRRLEPTSYAAPEELQDGVIEPTAIFNPGARLPDWSNVEITV